MSINRKPCKRLVALLLPLLLISAFTFQTFSQTQSPDCPGNLLKNGDFATGVISVGNGNFPPSTVPGWSPAFGTPQIAATMGCNTPNFVTMWGNKVVGEGIKQTVNIQKNHTYKLSLCVRVDPTVGKYVRFNVRAWDSNTTPITYTGAAPVIGLTGNITNSTTWTPVTLPNWTAPSNFDTITINPENDNTANDGNTVSWGWIDNVCLQEVLPPELYSCDGCKDITTKTDLETFSHISNGVYNFTPVLSTNQQNIIRVTADVISTSSTYSPASCGTNGPVNSYVVGASTAGSLSASVTVPGGHEVIWHGFQTNLSGVSFPMQFHFPPPPKGKCTDTLSFCVKYTITSRDCKTCEVIVCYGPFKRSGLIISTAEDIKNTNLTP